MIPAVFINLDAASERRAFMQAQGARLGLALERFPAISAATIPAALTERLSDTWERPLRPVELALFLSHRALWARAAQSEHGLVILEDDALLSRRLPDFLAEAQPKVDLVNLEWFGRRKFFRRGQADSAGASVQLVPVARDKAGAAAYWVSPQGAATLLAASEMAAAPADAFLYRSGFLDLAQAEPALAVQAHLAPSLGIDPGIASPTQVQAPHARLAVTPANARFHARRLRTQLSLVRFQLGRLGFYDLRRPAIDPDDFSPVDLPAQSAS